MEKLVRRDFVYAIKQMFLLNEVTKIPEIIKRKR